MPRRHTSDRWSESAHRRPTIAISGGAQHVREEQPPAGWTPPAPVGFVLPAEQTDHHDDQAAEPQLWEGDSA